VLRLFVTVDELAELSLVRAYLGPQLDLEQSFLSVVLGQPVLHGRSLYVMGFWQLPAWVLVLVLALVSVLVLILVWALAPSKCGLERSRMRM